MQTKAASWSASIRRAAAWLLLPGAASLAAVSAAQSSAVSPYGDPVELVRRAVHNEIDASHDSGAHFMFRGTKTTPKGSTTEIYVETNDATAGLIVAYDGKPLSPDQRRAEQARVQRFVSNPEELRKKRAQERENDERTSGIVRALPDAFLYEYAGEETGAAGIGRVGDPLVKLKFRPNPGYKPPSRVEEVLRGMQGYVLVDAAHQRIASIDGTLFKDVTFGWGILGRLDHGGHFVVHQEAVENDFWEISSMRLHFTGKILLVKSISIESTEVFGGFKQVPSDLSFAQGLELLRKEEAAEAVAGNHVRK